MRIVTFNVQHGRRPDGVVDTSVLAEYCAGLHADVLALQEVDVGSRRSGRVDQAAVVAEAAAMTGVFGRACRVGVRGAYGNALLVKGGVSDVEEVPLPRVAGHEPRAAIIARAHLSPGQLSVAVTHLSVTAPESSDQLQVVLQALSARPLPRVLMGDLNLAAADVAEAVAAAGMSLADPTAATFPAHAPRARIDHVAVSGLDVASVVVPPPAPVSDHRPVVAELARR